MTRWKREPRATLRLMHAHHQMSRWHGYVLEAAEQLGLLVGYEEYPNHHDGSRDCEWYTLAAQLEQAGGLRAVHARADELRGLG